MFTLEALTGHHGDHVREGKRVIGALRLSGQRKVRIVLPGKTERNGDRRKREREERRNDRKRRKGRKNSKRKVICVYCRENSDRPLIARYNSIFLGHPPPNSPFRAHPSPARSIRARALPLHALLPPPLPSRRFFLLRACIARISRPENPVRRVNPVYLPMADEPPIRFIRPSDHPSVRFVFLLSLYSVRFSFEHTRYSLSSPYFSPLLSLPRLPPFHPPSLQDRFET